MFLSGNDAVARAVWEAGTRVAAAYPGQFQLIRTPFSGLSEAFADPVFQGLAVPRHEARNRALEFTGGKPARR